MSRDQLGVVCLNWALVRGAWARVLRLSRPARTRGLAAWPTRPRGRARARRGMGVGESGLGQKLSGPAFSQANHSQQLALSLKTGQLT